MRSNLLFVFLGVLILNSGFAQSSTEIDTFRISSNEFIVEAPTDWFSIKVADEVQPDTSWNYVAKYISPTTNTVAQIAIQIINNSDHKPTKKEIRKFDKECTVTPIENLGFACYYLKYKPKKLKNCRKCELVYQDIYSIPLNAHQTLKAVFVGQGAKQNIEPLQIAFAQFVEYFLSLNYKNLKTFHFADFSHPLRRDALRVHKCYLVCHSPYRFSSISKLASSTYSIPRIDSRSALGIGVS